VNETVNEDTYIQFLRVLLAELDADPVAVHEILASSDCVALAHYACRQIAHSCPEEELEEWREELKQSLARELAEVHGY
jgi:hypothetical protein